MGLFRKKSARILRHGSATEERTVRTVDGETVTVRRFSTADPTTSRSTTKQKPKQNRSSARRRSSEPTSVAAVGRRTPRLLLHLRPLASRCWCARMPHQTQIVVLEGPVLVEHYVARSDKMSLVGNVYLGKVRNVLPGMEAASSISGAGKNGVLYAGDVNYAAYDLNGKPKRIEKALAGRRSGPGPGRQGRHGPQGCPPHQSDQPCRAATSCSPQIRSARHHTSTPRRRTETAPQARSRASSRGYGCHRPHRGRRGVT